MFRNLEAELRRAGISRKELAEKVGCNQGTLSLKLNGKSIVTLPEAMKMKRVICDALQTEFTLEYLFATQK
jgi:transcriptional regulator with XRE-family HTH domain